jgi:hypothetical protein
MSRLGLVALLATAVAAPAVAADGGVPARDYVACDRAGLLLVLAPSGRVVRRIPGRLPYGAVGITLTADRRSAYVSLLRGDEQPALYRVDLATGRRRLVGNGLSPAVSPDGRELAYLATGTSPRSGLWRVTALAVVEVATGRRRSIAAPPSPSLPAGPLGWSPDGRSIAAFDGTRIRLVDVAVARELATQPGVRGDDPGHPIAPRTYSPSPAQTTTAPSPASPPVQTVTVAPPPTPTTATSTTPAFLDQQTIVADYDCCIGDQHLVAFDLASGRRTPFATLYGPPVTIARVAPGRLLIATAANLLYIVTKGEARVLATGITAAAA